MRHFHCCSDLTFCSFSWRKTKPGLCISLQVSSQAIPLLANSTSNTHNCQKKKKKNLSDIFPLPFHSQTVYISWMMIFILCIFDAEVYRSSSCIRSQSSDGKMEVKKKNTHTHTQDKQKEMNFRLPTCPMNFTWCNFDGKCIRVVHPADKIFVGLWYNGRKALWWNIQITEERQNFLMCKYGYLPAKVRTNCSQKCY